MIYRDRQTGQFVSKAKWQRSKAHGGTRYVRTSIQVKRDTHGRFVVLPVESKLTSGILVRSGYSGRGDNSYSFTVRLAVNPSESISQAVDRIEKVVAKGAFDGKIEGARDFRWASFHNDYKIVERGLKLTRGTMIPISFQREAP